jgi:hypothetical protein
MQEYRNEGIKEYKTNPNSTINCQLLTINYFAKRTQFHDSRSTLLRHLVRSRAKNADIRPPKRTQFFNSFNPQCKSKIEKRSHFAGFSTQKQVSPKNCIPVYLHTCFLKTNPFNLCSLRNLRLFFSCKSLLFCQKTTFSKRTQTSAFSCKFRGFYFSIVNCTLSIPPLHGGKRTQLGWPLETIMDKKMRNYFIFDLYFGPLIFNL